MAYYFFPDLHASDNDRVLQLGDVLLDQNGKGRRGAGSHRVGCQQYLVYRQCRLRRQIKERGIYGTIHIRQLFPRSGPGFKPLGWFRWSEPELLHFGLFGPFGPCVYDDIPKLQNDPYWSKIHPHLAEIWVIIWPKMRNPHFMIHSWMWLLKFAL